MVTDVSPEDGLLLGLSGAASCHQHGDGCGNDRHFLKIEGPAERITCF